LASIISTAQNPSIPASICTIHTNTPVNLGHRAAHTLTTTPHKLPSVPQRLRIGLAYGAGLSQGCQGG